MSSQKHIYNTINQILNIIDELGGIEPPADVVKDEMVGRFVKDNNLKLYEVTAQEKVYVLASSVGAARDRGSSFFDVGDKAAIVTDLSVNQVMSGDGIDPSIDEKKFPIGGTSDVWGYSLKSVVPHIFPSKEKAKLEKKLEEATAKYAAAQDEYYRLFDQVQATK